MTCCRRPPPTQARRAVSGGMPARLQAGAWKIAKVIIDERRVSPHSDFISDLVNARDQPATSSATGSCSTRFSGSAGALAGTSRAAGGALYLLYTHDDQRQQLIDDPSAYSRRDRGMPAARQQRLFHLPAHRHPRHRGRRHAHPQGHGGAAVAARAELRSRRVSRSAALRHPSQAQAHPVVRGRAASLHRQHPRPHRHHHRDHAGCWRVSRRRGLPIRTSCRSTAAPSANCGCKACP